MNKNNCLIFDFETLGTQPDSIVLALAILPFNFNRFLSDAPYTFSELAQASKLQKYNVKEQAIKYKRSVYRDTLDWWERQSDSARTIMVPNQSIDVSIKELPDFFLQVRSEVGDLKYAFSRGTLDVIMLNSIFTSVSETSESPFPYYCWRDTRSYIDAILDLMGDNHSITNKFMPQNIDIDFIKHNPSHDISMDLMRIQSIMRAVVIEN